MSDTLTATLPTREVTLAWSDALSLELDFMDDTHREFVDLLAATELADDDTLIERFAAPAGRLDKQLHLLAHARLTDVFGQFQRANGAHMVGHGQGI